MNNSPTIKEHFTNNPFLLLSCISYHEQSLRRHGILRSYTPSEFIREYEGGRISYPFDIFSETTIEFTRRSIIAIAIDSISGMVNEHFIRIDEESLNTFIDCYFLTPLGNDENPFHFDADLSFRISNGILHIDSITIFASLSVN